MSLLTTRSYCDEDLINPATWPGVIVTYRFLTGSAGAATLSISIVADALSPIIATQRVLEAIERYAAITSQLQQQDVKCSLSTSLGIIADAETVSAAIQAALLQVANSALTYLKSLTEQAAPQNSAPPTPLAPPSVTISANVTPANAQAILKLSVDLTISRDAKSIVTPVIADIDDNAQALTQFATNFEAALPGLKLAIARDQIQEPLWVVNFTTEGSGFTFQATPTSARFFALPPLTTNLFSSASVLVPTYDSHHGLQWPEHNRQAFQFVDPDQSNKIFLQAIELILSPNYSLPGSTDPAVAASIKSISDAKANIARNLANTAQPIFATTDNTGLNDAREVLEQQLLQSLSNAYSTQTLLQIDFNVTGAGAGRDAATAPRLSGKLIPRAATASVLPACSFSTAQFPLTLSGSRLTSLCGVKNPEAQTAVTLTLDYQIEQIEFDIHWTNENLQRQRYSSWLDFIVPIVNTVPIANTATTQGEIGEIQIPIPLRGYPDSATLLQQTARSPDEAVTTNATCAQWNYALSISRQFSPQDQMALEVVFDQTAALQPQPKLASAQGGAASLFELLAAFASVWPAIAHDLAQLPDTANGKATDAARFAAAALADFSSKIQNAWSNAALHFATAERPAKTYRYLLSTETQCNYTAENSTATLSTLILDRIDQSVDFSTAPDDFLFTADASYAAQLNTEPNTGKVPAALVDLFKSYGFTLSDSATIKQKSVDNNNSDWLIVDAKASQTIHDCAAFNAPQIYRVTRADSTPAGDPVLHVWRQLLWPALRLSQDGAWLNATQACTGTRLTFDLGNANPSLDKILSLDFNFYRLNVLLQETAHSSIDISRNTNLLPGFSTHRAFIYQTPPMMFTSPITPQLTRSMQTSVQGNSLSAALSQFFKDLVSAQNAVRPDTTRNLRIAVAYSQPLDGIKLLDGQDKSPPATPPSYGIPILLVPLHPFNVSTDSSAAENSFCALLAKSIEDNAAAMGIVPAATGRWIIDVTLYAHHDEKTVLPLLNIEYRLLNG